MDIKDISVPGVACFSAGVLMLCAKSPFSARHLHTWQVRHAAAAAAGETCSWRRDSGYLHLPPVPRWSGGGNPITVTTTAVGPAGVAGG